MGARWKAVVLVVKLAVSVGLIWWAVESGLIAPSRLAALADRPLPVVLAMLLIAASVVAAAARWWLLLASQGIGVTWRRVLAVMIASQFGGTFLPGVIGADGVRAAGLCLAVTDRRGVAVLSILFDRLFGMLGIFIIALVLSVIEARHIFATPDLRPIGIATAVACLVLAGGLVAVVAGRFRHGRLPPLAAKVADALAAYGRDRRLLAGCLALSLLVHLLTVAGFYVLAASGNYPLPLVKLALAFVLSLVANMLPITPGGIGVGETTFAYLCRIIGGSAAVPYATLFFAFRAVMALALTLMVLPVLQVFVMTAFAGRSRLRPLAEPPAS